MNNQEKNTYVKDHITKALLKLLEMHNINEISIRDLCNEAGVGRASFYRNYDAKEDVIRQYAQYLLKEWEKKLEAEHPAGMSDMFISLLRHYRENALFYTMLYKQNMSSIILDAITNKMGISDDLSDDEAYQRSFFAYGIYGVINEWISRGMKQDPEKILSSVPMI